MAVQKIAKDVSESLSQNTDVLSDTSLREVDSMKTWMEVFDILQHNLINCPEESG
jgi:hypothetical protein